MTVLNQKTSASGHSSRRQNIESTTTVSETSPTPAGITILSNLEKKKNCFTNKTKIGLYK